MYTKTHLVEVTSVFGKIYPLTPDDFNREAATKPILSLAEEKYKDSELVFNSTDLEVIQAYYKMTPATNCIIGIDWNGSSVCFNVNPIDNEGNPKKLDVELKVSSQVDIQRVTAKDFDGLYSKYFEWIREIAFNSYRYLPDD